MKTRQGLKRGWSCGVQSLQKQTQRVFCGGDAHGGAAQWAKFDSLGLGGVACLCQAKANPAFGFVFRSARACDAGCGNGKGGV